MIRLKWTSFNVLVITIIEAFIQAHTIMQISPTRYIEFPSSSSYFLSFFVSAKVTTPEKHPMMQTNSNTLTFVLATK